MTEYDYSPEAWEAHLAKQTRIAEWSARATPANCANPFKPTEDEIARLEASGFYKPDRKRYHGPDRPPSPGGVPVGSLPHGRGSYQVHQHPIRSASGSTTPVVYPNSGQQSPIVIPPGHTAHVPIYNPATRQFEWQKFDNPSRSKGHHSKSSSPSRSGSSSIRPKPSRSATMPVGYTYPSGAQQQPGNQQQQQYVYPYPYAQQPPHSGSTVASQASGSVGYAAYPGGTVIVDGATPKKSRRLHKTKEA